MADERDRRARGSSFHRGDDRGRIPVGERWFLPGYHASKGLCGDLGGGAGARERARQQLVRPADEVCEAPGGYAELGFAPRRERAVVIRDAWRSAGNRLGMADEEEDQATASRRGARRAGLSAARSATIATSRDASTGFDMWT